MARRAITIFGIWLFLAGAAIAQEARIVGPLADGTPAPPAAPKKRPEFTVETTDVHRLADRKVIMRRVADPGLPDPPPPPPPTTPDDTEAMRNSPAFQRFLADHRPSQLIYLSATVVDRKATFLRWWHKGEEYQAWSNVDFNYLGGFAEFESKGNRYAMLMSLGNFNGDQPGRIPWPGDPPNLGVTYPAYALTMGDESNAEAMAMMDALHDIYAAETTRLIAASEGRERARAEREAALKANPPKPVDIVIHFWPRKGSRYLDGIDGNTEQEDSQ